MYTPAARLGWPGGVPAGPGRSAARDPRPRPTGGRDRRRRRAGGRAGARRWLGVLPLLHAKAGDRRGARGAGHHVAGIVRRFRSRNNARTPASHGQGASACAALIVGVRVEAAENLLIRAVGHDGGVAVLVIDGRQAPRTDHDAIRNHLPLDEFGGFDLNLSAASAAPFGVGHGLRSCPCVSRRAPLLDRPTAQGHRRRCSRTRWRPGRLGRDESFEAGRRDRQRSRNQNPVAILSACQSFGVGTGPGL